MGEERCWRLDIDDCRGRATGVASASDVERGKGSRDGGKVDPEMECYIGNSCGQSSAQPHSELVPSQSAIRLPFATRSCAPNMGAVIAPSRVILTVII
jgi:hypothetical protein